MKIKQETICISHSGLSHYQKVHGTSEKVNQALMRKQTQLTILPYLKSPLGIPWWSSG